MAALPENPNPTNFTDLPDCMIHRIFSFLDKTNIMSLSFVSKRLIQSCLTSPYISFIAKRCDWDGPSYCKQFQNCLEKFWSDRDASMDIVRPHIDLDCLPCKLDDIPVRHKKYPDLVTDIIRLHIDWNCETCTLDEKYSALVMELIRDAIKLNVQELVLKLSDEITIPLSMLVLGSLTILEFSGAYDWSFDLVFPSLRVLSLKDRPSNIYGMDLTSAMISYSFPSLKKLSLLRFFQLKFIITNSTLEELTISISDDYDDECYEGFCDVNIFSENLKTLCLDLPHHRRTTVKIIAPKLVDFTFKTGVRECLFEGEFLYLRRASLELPYQCDYLDTVHRIIACATSLETNFVTVEVLFKNDLCRQVLIENLHNLVLKIDKDYSSKDDSTASIIAFLKQFVNLKSITIKHPRSTESVIHMYTNWEHISWKLPLGKYDINREHIEPQSLTSFESLKEVLIELICGTKEMEIVEYLLKYARNLKRVTVFYYKGILDMLECINTRNFEIAAKKVEFVFVSKEFSPNDKKHGYGF